MIKYIGYVLYLFLSVTAAAQPDTNARIIVLGVAQDGGYPHAGCTRACCNKAWAQPDTRRSVVSLALLNPGSKDWWLFEATPDIKEQLNEFSKLTAGKYNYLPSGIFITHAHIGHYTGLMQLGREVMSTKSIPVYVLPGMRHFLETNGPWSQLVTLKNIELRTMESMPDLIQGINDGQAGVSLGGGAVVGAFTVPHRDEFSETAGFFINTPGRKYVFIPDIDKWAKWNTSILDVVQQVDVAFVDATFYQDGELPGRSISEVPHPFVTETMNLFLADPLSKKGKSERSKVYFIHFNHTNPLLWDTVIQKEVKGGGFNLAVQGQRI